LPGCERGAAPETPRIGGTAVIAGYVELRTMNPLYTLPDVNKALERYALFTPLLRFDAGQHPEPRLATSWDTVRFAPDSLALTFRLRDDVRWHDGAPVTARDVAFTFELAKDPRTGYVDAAVLAHYAGAAEVLDEHTVRFRLRAHADFLEPWFLLPPLPRHLLAGTPPEQLAQHPFGATRPVGSGPFRFVRRVAGSEWVFEANPEYPEGLGGRPRLDRLVYRTVPEQTGILAELLTGRVHLGLSIRPPQVPRLQQSPQLRVLEMPVANWVFLGLNTRLPQFDTREERRAIALALDRQAIIDGIMGGRNVAGRSVVTPVHWAYDSTDSRTAPRHDPAAAAAMLARAGWIDRDGDGIREDAAGHPFRFRLKVWQGSGTYAEIAEVIQAQLRQVGVQVDVQIVEFNTFLAQMEGRPGSGGVRRRDFEAMLGNLTDNLRKDDGQLFHSNNADGPRFWSGFSSPVVDSLLDTLGVTLDRAAARPLWREYQRQLHDEAPVIVLFYARGINGVRRELEGLVDDWRGPIATVQQWWLRPGAGDTATAGPTEASRKPSADGLSGRVPRSSSAPARDP
ncbi:MAG TPA: ABC transporter substrate-binding protein, partial [Longimicrobiales bacterium]|nr:ABC transporter substrate-binding protein [Longimicrobiales bacterium]